MDKHNSDWMTGGTWYNTCICKKIHGNVFEAFIRNETTDRYIMMCAIDEREHINPPEQDDGRSGGGYPIPSN